MTKRGFWMGIAAAACALVAGGCDSGSQCKPICEEINACPDTIVQRQCEDECKQQDEVIELAKCRPTQQKFEDCVNAIADVCDAPNKCATESLAARDCIQDYCTANAADCVDHCKYDPTACSDGS